MSIPIRAMRSIRCLLLVCHDAYLSSTFDFSYTVLPTRVYIASFFGLLTRSSGSWHDDTDQWLAVPFSNSYFLKNFGLIFTAAIDCCTLFSWPLSEKCTALSQARQDRLAKSPFSRHAKQRLVTGCPGTVGPGRAGPTTLLVVVIPLHFRCNTGKLAWLIAALCDLWKAFAGLKRGSPKALDTVSHPGTSTLVCAIQACEEAATA